MILNLTDLSNEPLQSQIYRQIRTMILAGDLNAGEMLPSIRGLARNEKVSVITVQRGYEILEKEGLIVSRRGKGFFVAELHVDRKKELSEERFIEKIEPIIQLATEEGMTIEGIEKILLKILKSK
ncbi:MAG: GntR family transcriptional regulator [Bacteroidetes bacterium]|nr:GntR family transcriptional regulator [Bacteroidota bacterium]MBU1114279.1 GntR family transcriptional regulator [Bacteroidota bacterium]MBU1798016.1 GntR family transcriptional regulator [Bacteroidota bacterium]